MKFGSALFALASASLVSARLHRRQATQTPRDSLDPCTTSADCTVSGETCFAYNLSSGKPFLSCQNRSTPTRTCNFDSDCDAIHICQAFGHDERGCVRKFTSGAQQGDICVNDFSCGPRQTCEDYLSKGVKACVDIHDESVPLGTPCGSSIDCPYTAACLQFDITTGSTCQVSPVAKFPPTVDGVAYPYELANYTAEEGVPTPTSTAIDNSTVTSTASSSMNATLTASTSSNATVTATTSSNATATATGFSNSTMSVSSVMSSTSSKPTGAASSSAPSSVAASTVGKSSPAASPASSVHSSLASSSSAVAQGPVTTPSSIAGPGPAISSEHPSTPKSSSSSVAVAHPEPSVASATSSSDHPAPAPYVSEQHPSTTPPTQPQASAAPVVAAPAPVQPQPENACPKTKLCDLAKQLTAVKCELEEVKALLKSLTLVIQAAVAPSTQ